MTEELLKLWKQWYKPDPISSKQFHDELMASHERIRKMADVEYDEEIAEELEEASLKYEQTRQYYKSEEYKDRLEEVKAQNPEIQDILNEEQKCLENQNSRNKSLS